jgi:2-polyprenyl-3-methyl-5-hydroxy-6-metoxy-1,4-benzoquinol methylase
VEERTGKTEINCPVFESWDYQVKIEPWVDIHEPQALYGAASGIQGTQRLVLCRDCRTLYENPRYPDEVIAEGYASALEAGFDSQHAMRVMSFSRALISLKGKVPSKGVLLDIGTAGGAFLDAAEGMGYRAVGLEPSVYLVQQGKGRGLDIHQGTIDSHPFGSGSFDMVCLWDVLEHMPHPREILAMIRPLLKPGGVLLINYPDSGTWQAKIAGRRFWWISSVHLLHFSRTSIARICEVTGFAAYHFQRHWQTLEAGYLGRMAVRLGIPGSQFLYGITPESVKRIPVPYYASQTTALAKVR